MALPERERAAGWVGQTVIDRDGTEIGTCTAVYADDATGLTEWMSVGFEGRSVIVPVVDAAERGGRVQVAVGRADVASAPSVDDGQHVFGDEEVALYQHYGIEYSRAASDTVLPAGEAPSEGAGSGSEASTTAFPGAESDETPSAQRGQRLAAAAAALTALVTVVAAVIRLRRRPSRRPPVRRRPADEAVRRARTASVHLGRRARHLAGVTAPLLATAGHVTLAGARTGAAAAGQAANGTIRFTTSAASSAAGRVGAAAQATSPLLTTAGHVTLAAARTGAVAARQSAHEATRLTTTAASRAAGLLGSVAQAGVQVGRRVGGVVESVPEEIVEGGHRIQKMWRRVMGMLSAGVGFAAGYVLGARAGRQRFEQIKQAAGTVAQRPEVQQALQRVKAAAAPGQDAASAGAHQPPAPLTARLRRRRPATDTIIITDASSSPASDADLAAGLPADPGPVQQPPAMPPPASDDPGDPQR